MFRSDTRCILIDIQLINGRALPRLDRGSPAGHAKHMPCWVLNVPEIKPPAQL